MGGRLTSFENRSRLEMEIRVFISPTQFFTVIKIEPGGVKEIANKKLLLCQKGRGPDNPAFIMVFLDGKFILLHPKVFSNGDKIICDVDEAGLLNMIIGKCGVPGFNRIRGFSYFPGMVSRKMLALMFFAKRERGKKKQHNSKAVQLML